VFDLTVTLPDAVGDTVTDQHATVRDRLTTAGLSPERIAEHLEQGRIRVDDVKATDLDMVTEPGSRIVVWPTADD